MALYMGPACPGSPRAGATLVTTRPTPNPSDGEPTLLQDLRYTYDPVGNVIDILDASKDTLAGPPTVEPRCTYVYDALYRLTSATGREHDDLGGTSAPGPELPDWATSAHLNDWQAIHKYREIYGYDEVGNLESVEHRIGEVTMWTRQALHATTSNRLRKSWTGGTEPTNDQYTYDAHGNLTSMPHLSAMDWSSEDHLAHVDLGGGGDVDFLYDAGGERLRKRYDHSNLVEERVYLGALEVYRKWEGGNLVKTTTSVHVMDGTRRVALVEYESTNDRRVRYPLGNHLGSACIEVDDEAKVISEEEYLPYGATAYRRHWGEVPEKRYRYTGKERDEETGLQYHSARYYAPWLGRWTAADPAGFVDGTNLYAYCRGSPIASYDGGGRNSEYMQAFTDWATQVARVGQQLTSGTMTAAQAKTAERGAHAAYAGRVQREGLRQGFERGKAMLSGLSSSSTTGGSTPWSHVSGNWRELGSYATSAGAGFVDGVLAVPKAIGAVMTGDAGEWLGEMVHQGARLVGLEGSAAQNVAVQDADNFANRVAHGLRTLSPENGARAVGVGAGIVAGAAALQSLVTTAVRAIEARLSLDMPLLGLTEAELGLGASKGAAFSRLAPGGGLGAHEAAGGHLIARHVGLTDAQLAGRLAGGQTSAASTFASRAEAEAAVAGAFDANAAQVGQWVSSGASGRLVINAPFSGGRVLLQGATKATPGTGVRVVLQGNGAGGYHILTGFPTP